MDNRCYSCMKKIEGTVCQFCGNDNSKKQPEKYMLKQSTVLQDRYYIGNVLDYNGESISYIAYDIVKDKQVRIKEFFIPNMATRAENGVDVVINPGMEIQFKALMSDFVELSKQLIELKENSSLLKALDIFSENKTIYTIYENVDGVLLNEYIDKKGGTLSWQEAETMFMPLIYTLKLLVSKGIIHRGISPENIIVTKEGNLKLKGVCTSSVRAINTEIIPELFVGYAAPEQYQKCVSHGEWTDVYGLCAVLYMSLTDAILPRADLRLSTVEEIYTPRELNPAIPENVSYAISKGLEVDINERTATINDLIGNLYSESRFKNGPIRITDEIDNEEPVIDEEKPAETDKKKSKNKIPLWLLIVIIALPIMVGLFFLLQWLVLGGSGKPQSTIDYTSSTEISSNVVSETTSSEIISSQDTSSVSGESIVMEDFVGKYYDDIISSSAYKAMFKFEEPEYAYNDTVAKDQIISQSVEKGKVITKGDSIKFVVSKGKQYVTIPSYQNADGSLIPAADYKKTIEGLGLKVIEKTIADDKHNKGDIVDTSIKPNTIVDREKTDTITIFIMG